MSSKFFGQFLLERGVINKDQLLKALDTQRESNRMLGEIAVSMDLIDEKQAWGINQKQRIEDKKFGEIAIEMGLLNDEQIEQLLERQKSERKLFGEILVEQGVLDQQSLETELSVHRGERADEVKVLQKGTAKHLLGNIMTSTINNACKLSTRVLKSPCQFSSLVFNQGQLPDVQNICHVCITGSKSFNLGFGCDDDTVMKIGAGFMGIDQSEFDQELARDAFGEFLNTVMGYVLKEVLTSEDSYESSPPAFTRDLNSLYADVQKSIAVKMTSELGDYTVIVSC